MIYICQVSFYNDFKQKFLKDQDKPAASDMDRKKERDTYNYPYI